MGTRGEKSRQQIVGVGQRNSQQSSGMKLKYEPASKGFRIRCNETLEEKDFDSEAECVEWAKKVANTFAQDMTFTLTRVTEEEAQLWATREQEIGMVR